MKLHQTNESAQEYCDMLYKNICRLSGQSSTYSLVCSPWLGMGIQLRKHCNGEKAIVLQQVMALSHIYKEWLLYYYR